MQCMGFIGRLKSETGGAMAVLGVAVMGIASGNSKRK